MKQVSLVAVVLVAFSFTGFAASAVVTVQNPANDGSVTSPVAVHATYSGTASYMKLWVDGVAVTYVDNTSTFSYSATMSAGSHLLDVQAQDAATKTVYTTPIHITVTSGTTNPPPSDSVTVQSPAANSTVASPVAISATYNGTASYMKLWIDGKAITYLDNTSTFSYSAKLANGAHLLDLQAQDATSKTVYSTPVNITVASAVVIVSPSAASIAQAQTQQFTVTGATGSVTWSVSPSSAGTISASGLFTAGSATGIATITAADSGTGLSGNASVGVVAFAIAPNPASVAVNGTVALAANAPATWAVSGSGSITNTSTASTTATYTAPASAGTDTVTATEAANSAITATNSIVLAALAVTPGTASTPEGQTQQFTANASVTWTASCGSVNSAGLFLAPNVAGPCTVTATQATSSNPATAIDNVTAPSDQGLNYVTWKNDNGHSGQQRNETVLTPGNVNSSTFGVKFSVALDGMVFAQPLYMSGLTVNGATHNVVFAATEHDSVYAFDSDTSATALWKTSFLINGATTVPPANVGSTIAKEVGITGTPVIDPATGTLYVIAETLESGAYFHRLHALDVTTGAEKFGGPVVIQPAGFASKEQLQRPALILANGNVYAAFGSQGDVGSYHGWVIAYSATTLAQVAAWSDSPGGNQGGIWGSGGAVSADSNGDIYITSGNGSFNGTTQFSMSIVKLSPSLTVLDWFAPFNATAPGDEDLGSGGVLVVPDQSGAFPHELIECGKLPPVFVLNRDNLGQKGASSDSQIVQELVNVVGGLGGPNSPDHCYMTPAYWEQNLYFIGRNDVLKQFTLDPSTGLMSATPASQGSFTFVFPGAQPVTSSNGSINGIVWAVDGGNPAQLHAFDATNVSTTLYTSGTLVYEKWAVPTVVDGKVFVAGQGKLFVFGLF